MKRTYVRWLAMLPVWVAMIAFTFFPALASPAIRPGLNLEVYTIQNWEKGDPSWQLCEGAWTSAPNIEAWFDAQYEGIVAGCRGDFVAVHYYGWIRYEGHPNQTTNVVFDSITDDGFTLDIAENRVIDDWNFHGCTGRQGSFEFENNKWYPLDAWFFEWGGGACSTLYWEVDGNRTVVPESAFAAEISTEPEPEITCWDNSVVFDLSECVPSPSPTEPTPTNPEESQTPTEEPTSTPSETVEPSPTDTEPSIYPSPTPSTVDPSPSYEKSLTLSPTTPAPLPSPDVTDPTPEPAPSDLRDNDSISQEDQAAIDEASADGVLTEEEKQQIADILVESFADEAAIPFAVLQDSGLDYEDLPPEQPVTLENGVVLTAEVADAIEIFESPTEVLTTVFTDPGKALKAIGNVGADLPPEVRDKAQKIVVSAIIVVQVIGGTVTTLLRMP